MRFTALFFLLSSIVMIHAQESLEGSTPQVKISWIKNYDLEPGHYQLSIPLNNGKSWKAAISIPENVAEKSAPLVIALHWAGPEGTQKEYANCLAFPALEALNAIVIAPSAEGMHWITPIMEKRVIRLVRQLVKYWTVDPDQVYITGYSNGGIGTWHYMNNNPSVFKKGIAIAGMYESKALLSPIHIIHGKQDELFPVTQIMEIIENTEQKETRIGVTIVPELYHFMACAYQDVLAEVARSFFKVD